MDLREYIAPDLLEKFEFYSYNHALEIITQAFPATSTSSSIRGRPNSGDAFPRSRLRKRSYPGISTDIISTF